MNASMCIYICIFRLWQLQPTSRRVTKQRCMLTHSEKRDGDSIGSPRAFRGAESASRKPAQNGYGEDGGGARFQSGNTSLSPKRDTFCIPLPLFYSPGREAVIIRYIIIILCPFGERYTSILSLLNACYLGFHFSRLVPTYLLYNEKCARV